MTDETWSELCRCKSLPELRLKAVVFGVDEDEQLAWLWLPRDDGDALKTEAGRGLAR